MNFFFNFSLLKYYCKEYLIYLFKFIFQDYFINYIFIFFLVYIVHRLVEKIDDLDKCVQLLEESSL